MGSPTAQLPQDVHPASYDGNNHGWATKLGELADYLAA